MNFLNNGGNKMKRVYYQIKRSSKLVPFLLVFVVLICSGSSICMGKGEIHKICVWENEDPIVGAKVFLEETNETEYTDSIGIASFYDLEAGVYHIFVDIDNDGIWDDSDEVTLGVGEILYIENWFPLPKLWILESFNIF